MAIYMITGKLGSGKTLASVGRIRDALLQGRRVATNLDLRLENLLPQRLREVSCVRIPDKPGLADLESLGCGNETRDEDRNGVIVLDELGSWLNARTFNDKARMPVIDWLLHSRKHGWDVIFICQHIEQIDKQVRTSLVEFLCHCRRLDRVKVPFVGKWIRRLTLGACSGNMPRVHLITVRYGCEPGAIVSDRWAYRGADLYDGYETRQVFADTYACGPYSYLSPWHLGGWRLPSRREVVMAYLQRLLPAPRVGPPRKPQLPAVAALSVLSPDAAVAEWRRLDAAGLLG